MRFHPRCARRSAVVLAAAVAASSAAEARAGTPFQIGHGRTPEVAVDERGTGHFVWNEERHPLADVVHYCRVPRGARACDVQHSFVPRSTAPDPAAGDPYNDGYAHHVLAPGNGRVIILTHRGAAEFATPAGLRTDGVNIIWRSNDGGQTFGEQEPVSQSSDPIWGARLGTGPAGEGLYLIGHGTLQYAPFGQFTERSQQMAMTGDGVGGALAFLAPDKPMFAWGKARDDGTGCVEYAIYQGGDPNSPASWGAKRCDVPLYVWEPRLADGPAGVLLFYREPDGTASVRKWDGTAFGAPIALNRGGAVDFDFEQDGGGGVHAHFGGPWYRSSTDGASFGPMSRLFADEGSRGVRIAAAPDHGGFAVGVLDPSGGLRGEIKAVALEEATPLQSGSHPTPQPSSQSSAQAPAGSSPTGPLSPAAHPLSVRLVAPSLAARRFANRGANLMLTTSHAGALSVTATVSGRTARALRLSGSSARRVIVATGHVRVARPGTWDVRLRPTRAASRRLRRARFTIAVRVQGLFRAEGRGSARPTTTFRLRR